MARSGRHNTYESPGPLTEPAGKHLGSFGITRLPGARVNVTDPPVSARQQRFMGADLRRKRMGKPTRTGMSEADLEHMATKPKKGYRKP